MNKIKTSFLSRKRAITTFLSRKFMITRSSIAYEDFLGSSIVSQVMPPCQQATIASFIVICKSEGKKPEADAEQTQTGGN